ncbi:MAG TPA: MFS transporter [Candidatus Limnocylindria bacterium]|nr:MFS transporter [Candidatus Limnocylindria bacterium]
MVAASALRLATLFYSNAELLVYVVGFIGIGTVALANWRLPGSSLIALGTFMNVLVILLNSGMPYDVPTAVSVGVRIPDDALHVVLDPATRLPLLADIIPFAIGPLAFTRAVYSVGDFLLAFGGFLIPFMWLQEAPAVDAARREIRSANFAFFWLAQVISRFGDPITLVALVFVTYRATQSALLTAVAVAITIVPNALFSLFGGAIADALGPRRAMLWCDIVRVPLIAAVPVLLAMNMPLAVIFFAVFLAGISGAVFGPARGALVPALLTRDRLAAGNSLVFASDRAVEIGGALAGGVLVATIGENAFYVDALTFGLSALLLSRVVVQEPTGKMRWSGVIANAFDGLRFLRKSTVLWANTLFSLSAQVANPIINSLTPVLLIRRFAQDDPARGAVLYGAAEAAIAFGAVLGSTLLPRYVSGFRKGRLLIAGFGATGLVIVLIALAPTFAVAAILFGLLGITNVLFYVPTVTILQEGTPTEMTARVFGARIALTNLSWVPAIFLGGVLSDSIGVDVLLILAGSLTLATALVGAFLPVIRDVP